MRDPYIRQLVVSWISVLDAVPDLNMLEHLPQYLAGLFNMLSDSQKGIVAWIWLVNVLKHFGFVSFDRVVLVLFVLPDIRQQADACLAGFLREITEVVNVEFAPLVAILVDQCTGEDKPPINRLTGLTWLFEFIRLSRAKLIALVPDMVPPGRFSVCLSAFGFFRFLLFLRA